MRIIKTQDLGNAIKEICRIAEYHLNDDLLTILRSGIEHETSEIAIDVLNTIIKNSELAREKSHPLCQDTGIGIFFVEYGEGVRVEGGDTTEIIQKAMQEVYEEDCLRKSMVSDPLLSRINTGTNLPPIIHWELVPGENLKITFLPKGAGAENMSRLKMFHPLTDKEDIIDFVVETVQNGGGNACPPLILGVGIGGSFDYAPLLAKKALLRIIGEENPDKEWAAMESEILKRVNDLGIGPMGLGGNTTALAVNIMAYPCHAASLPVAINLQCHAHRFKSIVI